MLQCHRELVRHNFKHMTPLPHPFMRVIWNTLDSHNEIKRIPKIIYLIIYISGTIHLMVFIRRDLIWFCSLPEDASLSVRPGTAFRTKGAVAISFALFGSTFLFVTAHLTAHQEKVKERVSDIKRIIRSIDLPKNLPCRHKSKGDSCLIPSFIVSSFSSRFDM